MGPARCPAATALAQTRDGSPGVVCGVIALDNRREPLSGEVDPLITEARDRSSLIVFCCGRALASDRARLDGDPSRKAGDSTCYTDCPVWRGEVDRLERQKRAPAAERLRTAA